MVRLENLQRGTQLRGIVPDQTVTLASLDWHGADALEVIFRRADGQLGWQLLYRNDEQRLELATSQCSTGSPCAFCWPTIPAPARRSWPDCSSAS